MTRTCYKSSERGGRQYKQMDRYNASWSTEDPTSCVAFGLPCEGRRGRFLDTCTPCKMMLRDLVGDIIPQLCSFAHCMGGLHGMPLNMLTEDNRGHGNDHITFQGMYENATKFARELEVIKKYGPADVVYDCFNQNILDQLMKIICLLKPTQLESNTSQDGCLTRLPREFRRYDRTAQIDYVINSIRSAHRQFDDFVRVLL